MKTLTRMAALGCVSIFALPGVAWADDQPPANASANSDPAVWRISTGVNYSEGDYGDVQSTRVISAPLAIKYSRGGFSVRVSVPYVHIDGPGSLIDTPQGRDAGFGDQGGSGGSGSGSGSNGSGGSGSGGSGSGSGGSGSGSGGSGSGGSGSGGSGSGGSGSGGSGSGGSGSGGSGSGGSGSGGSGSAGSGVVPVVGGASNRRDGIGDVAVTIGYSLAMADTTYLDLSARAKLPTASTARRIGTGEVDFTLGADLVQDIGRATVYVGGRRKIVGKPAGSALRDVWGFGGGLSYSIPGGTMVGADYDWQQGSVATNGPSSEVTGWVNFGLSRRVRLQVYASTGFSTNSVNFASGLTLSYRLN